MKRTLFLFIALSFCASAANLEKYSLDEWRAHSKQQVLSGKVTDFRREFKEWLSSKNGLRPDELVALLDNPVISMAIAQAEVVSAFPLELNKASRSDEGREFLADVFSDPEWIDSFILAGRMPLKTGDGFSIASKIWKEDETLHSDPLWRRVLTALVLESASLDKAKVGEEKVVSSTEARFRLLKEAQTKGKLFDRFKALNVWEMRFVVGSPMRNSDMTWVHQKVDAFQLDRKKAGEVSRGGSLVPYRMTNKHGVSIQTAGFYDGKPVTMQLLTEYGAVCGGISLFSTNFCLANGIPAFTMGQIPDHCAFCWKPDDKWIIGNDVHGWGPSRISPIYEDWGDYGAQILLADALLSKSNGFPASCKVLILSKFRNRTAESTAFAKLAIAKEPLDFNAWLILAHQYDKYCIQVAEKEPAMELLVRAVNALGAYPIILDTWFSIAGEGIVKEIDQLFNKDDEFGGDFAIAEALATKCSGVSITPTLQSLVRIRLRMIKQENRFAAFQKGNPVAFYADMSKRYDWKVRKMFSKLEAATVEIPSTSAFFQKFTSPLPKKSRQKK